MKTTASKIAIMQAYENGAEIEYKDHLGEYLGVLSDPGWNWGKYIYYIREHRQTDCDIVRKLLEEGKLVWCGVSNRSQDEADNHAESRLQPQAITEYRRGFFYAQLPWRYVSPIDTSEFVNYVPEVKE